MLLARTILLSLFIGSSTENGSAQWFLQEAETNAYMFNVHFVNLDTGWIAYGDTVLTTRNGGSDWIQIPVGLEVTLTDVFFINSRIGWASGGNTGDGSSAIIRSTDGGLSWIDVSPPLDFFIDGLFFHSENVGWGFGQEGCCTGKIVKTVDGGLSWTEQPVPSVGYLSSGFFVDSLVGWVVGLQTILATVDGGNKWVEQDTGYTHSSGIPLSSVYFVNRDTGWVVGGISWVSVIAKTVDGGETWIHDVFQPPSPELDVGRLSGVHFASPDTGWAVGRVYPGSEELILKTTDGGETWARQDMGLGNQLFSVFFVDGQHGWAAGERGTILATTNGGVTFVRQDDMLPRHYSLDQNYPNPFNPSTTITYSIPQSGHVTLKVYNTLGQEIATLVDQDQDAGDYNVEFFPNTKASGAYLYRLEAGGLVEVKKLVFAK
jgi:photosystem II stability/assembly factor-like uncharacterized protein